MTYISNGKRSYTKFKSFGEQDAFLNRISKTLYYSKLPINDRLSLPVTELAAEIFTEVKNGQSLERLDMDEASRISRNACVSPCSLVLALLYLERLKDCNPEYLQRVAPSELFLVSLMVASKFLNDDGEEDEVYNDEWAQSGHLPLSKMNSLEKDFLKAIDWEVFAHNEDFWKRLQRLEKDIAYKEGRKRGWFSYTDLNSLLDSSQLAVLIQTVLGISSLCLVSYAIGIVALLGSVAVASQLSENLLTLKHQNHLDNASNMDCSATNCDQQQASNDQSEDILLPSLVEPATICNESCNNCEIYSNKTEMRWKLLGTTITIPDFRLDDWEKEFYRSKAFITDAEFFDTVNPNMNKHMKTVNWNEMLSSSLQFPAHNRNYFSKVIFSH